MEISFIIGLFIIAYLYASVGHGGASGYLALMAFYGVAPMLMKSSSLILNLFVSSIAFIQFYRSGHLKMHVLIPFIILSIPAAYIGAQLNIPATMYKHILAVFLIIAIIRLVYPYKYANIKTKNPSIFIALIIGGIIGFFSGLIGIGGGIILTPILLFARWATVKEAACISAAFIFVNSIAGILGLYTTHDLILDPELLIWIVTALVGGLLGSYIGAYKLSTQKLKYLLSVVLIIATIKLFMQ